MPRRKDISNDLEEAIVTAILMAICKQFKFHHSIIRKFIHKWKTFKTDTILSKFTPRSDRIMLREMAVNPRTSLQTLHASVNMLNDKVHDSTIRKIWHMLYIACLEGLPEESLFYLSKKKQKTCQDGLGLQGCIWTNHKTSITMSFEQTRPKWRYLAIMHSATFGENLKSISEKNTSC